MMIIIEFFEREAVMLEYLIGRGRHKGAGRELKGSALACGLLLRGMGMNVCLSKLGAPRYDTGDSKQRVLPALA